MTDNKGRRGGKRLFTVAGALLLAAGQSGGLSTGTGVAALAQAYDAVKPVKAPISKAEESPSEAQKAVLKSQQTVSSTPGASTKAPEAPSEPPPPDVVTPQKTTPATPAKAEENNAAAAKSEVPVTEKRSVFACRIILEQGEQETFQAISQDKLDGFVKAVNSATDNYLNKQSAFATRTLIIHSLTKADGSQTFSMTSKPGLSGPITSGLDQALRSIAVLPVKDQLSMELVLEVADEQTQTTYKARHLIRSGKAAEAVALLEPLAKEECKNAFVWQTLGWAYSAKGDFPNAEKTLKRSIELDPRDFDSWANLVSTYHSEGKVHESEQASKRNLDCAPNEESTDIVNINSALYSGEWAAAESILRKLCKASGDYGTAYRVILAYTLRWQGKNDEAKQLLESALKQQGEVRQQLDDYYEKLAEKQLALLKGDWKTAVELGKLDLSKDPKDYESLYDMGLALKGEGKLEEARKAFEKAIQPVTPKSVLKAVDVQIKELSSTETSPTNKQNTTGMQ